MVLCYTILVILCTSALGLMSLRKGVFSAFLMAVLLSLTACVFFDSSQAVRSGDISSTYLGGVTIAELRLGDNISEVDLSLFTPTGSDHVRFDYVFNEILFYTDSYGNFTQILGRLVWGLGYEGVSFSVNGNELNTLEQLKDELGEYYNDYWFDREQGMRAITYADRENGINFTIAYSNYDGEFIWVILSEE